MARLSHRFSALASPLYQARSARAAATTKDMTPC